MSGLEAHFRFYRLLMDGKCLFTVTFWGKFDFLISNICYCSRLCYTWISSIFDSDFAICFYLLCLKSVTYYFECNLFLSPVLTIKNLIRKKNEGWNPLKCTKKSNRLHEKIFQLIWQLKWKVFISLVGKCYHVLRTALSKLHCMEKLSIHTVKLRVLTRLV